MARRRPTQERAQVTVAAILQATRELLVADGYGRATTNRIAARAGVSVGSLYHYFADKDAIIDALVDEVMASKLEVLSASLARTHDVDLDQGVAALIHAMLEAEKVDAALAHVLLTECPRGHRVDLHRRWQQRMTELLTARMLTEPERVRPRNVGLAAYVLVQAAFGVIQDALAHRPELLHGDALQHELTELVVRFLRPDSGEI